MATIVLPDIGAGRWSGPFAYERWMTSSALEGTSPDIDVVLAVHFRDHTDVPRLFPAAAALAPAARLEFVRDLQPMFIEMIRTPMLNVGILLMPYFAAEIVDPRARGRCRELLAEGGLRTAAEAGARILCLGALNATLAGYGRYVAPSAAAAGVTVTTGACVTAVSVTDTYRRATDELTLEPASLHVGILGVGGIGRAVARLLTHGDLAPSRLTLFDRSSNRQRLESLAAELSSETSCDIDIKVTAPDGRLDPTDPAYDVDVLLSAVSSADVIEIPRLAPDTILIDDSQPACWSRKSAWERCSERGDIVPCQAGLVDCGSIGYRSHFPFDFADASPAGSRIAWSCLAEGLLLALDPDLSPTVGEPQLPQIHAYQRAYDRLGFRAPPLQCGPHELPMQALRDQMMQPVAA